MTVTLHVYSFLPIVMAALCFSASVFELLTWIRVRGEGYTFAFAIICIAAAAYDLACAGEYNVVTPAASVIWLRIQAITLESTILAFFWYIAGRTGMVPRAVLLTVLSVLGFFILCQIFVPGNLTWDLSRPAIFRVHFPLGGEVVYTEVESGPLTDLQYLLGTALFAYMEWVIVRYYRTGNRREAVSLLCVSSVVFLAAMNDLAVSEALYSGFFTVEYAWLAVVIFVGLQRSGQLMEAAGSRRALVESEKRYRAIFEALQDVYFRADSHGILRFVSPSVRAYGYDPSLLIGRPVSTFSPDAKGWLGVAAALGREGSVSDFELSVVGGDSQTIAVSLNAHRLLDEKGKQVGFEGIIRDITDRKRAEKNLLSSLQEKSILLKEIHHRVKNNLQIISSLLYLQEVRIHDPVDKLIIQDCRNQVSSMALIHEDLYGSGDFRSVDFGAYLDKLVNRLLVAYRRTDTVAFIPAVQNISLGIDRAIPCGLVANELCTNALKYAFPPDWRERPCELRVELTRLPGERISLAITDNGVGVPAGFEPSRTRTLGMQIVERLVKQLGGTLRLDRGIGTRWVIEFPSG